MSWNLARLVEPISPRAFFDEYWERKPLLVAREQRDYFGSLLTLADIDRVISTYGLSHPDIQITNKARDVRLEEYTYPTGLIDVARLYQQFADGGTIILPQLHNRLPALASLCRSMEREMSIRFQTNIYFTPRNAQGFKAHFDSHDVFVLQIHGTKRWALYDTPVQLPFRGQAFDPEVNKPGNVTMEFALNPGDMVYVPRGVMHDANTGDGESLHITLGVLNTSWTDLLLESLAMVGLKDPDFRRSLPVGFANAEFDRGEARATFKKLLTRVAELADFDAAMDHFADDLVNTRHTLLPGQLEQIRRLPQLSLETRLGVRPSLLYKFEDRGESIALVCYGSAFTFPKFTEEALRFALAHEDFAVRELPGAIDENGKMVLAKRLVREGVLWMR
jgi:ribosomal protein L16 Arg81 hydroxylase